jgi:hypothetical protein
MLILQGQRLKVKLQKGSACGLERFIAESILAPASVSIACLKTGKGHRDG